MNFKQLFNVFSNRNTEVQPFVHKVPTTLRNKIILYCHEVFGLNLFSGNNSDYITEFWNEIFRLLRYLNGKVRLSTMNTITPSEDVIAYLLECDYDQFLDFVELIFKCNCVHKLSIDVNTIVSDINEFFISECVGFELTEMISEQVIEKVNGYPFLGRETTVVHIVQYPQIIKKENQLVHSNIIIPALTLLRDPKYQFANKEYLEAQEEYLRGDYGDCLTKCCSSLESVMKVICDKRRWDYKQTDTASTLIKIIINRSKMETFFEPSFTIIATLRNRLSNSHGAGSVPKDVPSYYAQFALNSTANIIVLLVQELG